MNAYLDLMLLTHMCLAVSSAHFLNEVSTSRLKRRGIFKLVALTLPMIFFIYFRFWISLLLILFMHVLIFVLFFKKHFLSPLLCYLVCYYGLSIAMSLFNEQVSLFHGVCMIHEVKGMLSILILPLFYILLHVVIKGVDALYHLGNYKMDAMMIVNGKKAKFRCYFDTGNTLKYQGVPVIFCLKKNWPFPLSPIGKVRYEGIGEGDEMDLESALISYKNNEDHRLVYVALVENKEGFNGCECLLNAYLN